MNRRPNADNNKKGGGGGGDGGGAGWWGLAAGAAGIAALAGGIYYATRSTDHVQSDVERSRTSAQSTARETSNRSSSMNEEQSNSISSYLSGMMDKIGMQQSKIGIPRASVPANPVLNNLNALLDDIYVRYVALKREDFELYFDVFSDLFTTLQDNMKSVDPYYRKYSSRKQFAGSHFDNLRIKKPDEFDMDIVIGLPLNFREDPNGDSDISIHHRSAGFVQLKTGTQFRRLPMRDGEEWLTNRAAYEWRDNKDYILRDMFTNWFKSVVDRALNNFPGCDGRRLVYVKGIPYTIRTTESGPAVTFIVENRERNFKLDVDFVPALKFPEQRWPVCRGYRPVPAGCGREDFMVVPKPNKAAADVYEERRSWRIAMHDQEKRLLHDLQNLKPTLRLIKKLRDTLDMNKIASYYIKTIFFHEVIARNDPSFWRQARGDLFRIMVQKLQDCIVVGCIPYFWNPENNLIGAVDKRILNIYARKLEELLTKLEQPNEYKFVAKYLLTPAEFSEYNRNFLRI